MPSSLLDKIKAMKIEDCKLNKLNQQSIGGLGRVVELTLKFIQVIHREYKLGGSRDRVSRVSTVKKGHLTLNKHILRCWCHCLEVFH